MYYCCRCEDFNKNHQHWHGLISLRGIKRLGLKTRLNRSSKLLNKSTLKKIHCLDHVVGVLRYLLCKTGGTQRTAMHHIHYEQLVWYPGQIHQRNRRKCPQVRDFLTTEFMGLDAYKKLGIKEEYVNGVHAYESCNCERGKLHVKRKELTKLKRLSNNENNRVLTLQEQRESLRLLSQIRPNVLHKLIMHVSHP